MGRAWAVGFAACVAALSLHAYPVARPFLFDDDFAILRDSWTWDDAWANLWRPWNEHAMPLGRLSTWMLVRLAGRPSAVALAATLQGPLAVVVGMGLVYRFVRRELGHPFYGMVAMALFGVTLKYNEAVSWFAASFAVLALDTTLLALLAAQRWRQTGRRGELVLCAFWSALAPAWFAGGILAGPLCCVYLFPGRWGWRNPGALLPPLAGTATFLVVSLPRTATAIAHAQHFQNHTATQSFQPLSGLVLTGRTLVDNLVFGVNAFGATCPVALVPAAVAVFAALAVWWARQGVKAGPRPQLFALGAAWVVVSYTLAYSFRAAWPYEAMMVHWTRYNLGPYLGLALFVCGGLPSREGTLFRLDASGALTAGQARGVLVLIGLLFLLQFPPGLAGYRRRDRDQAEQAACLRHIEAVDARCREAGISADAARRALGRLDIPFSGDPTPRINGWDLLRGSPTPRELSPDRVGRLLGADPQ
jgi:hypothetical protein